MKIKDLLFEIECILDEAKQSLLEFALPIKKIEAKIEDLTPQVMLHLFKIIAFGKDNPNTIHHWCAEIGAWMQSFCLLTCKSNNKLLPAEKIKNIMLGVYGTPMDFSTLAGDLYNEYGYSEMTNTEICEKVKSILLPLINYVQSLKQDAKINPDEIRKIILE